MSKSKGPLRIDDGLIILDKPYGHSSHEITAYIKKLLGIRRTGHAGTLDPQVSGVLPVALGRATKLLPYIAGKQKTYVGIIKFKHPISRNEAESLFSRFSGEITQTPPKESAVRKIPRKRRVYRFELLELNGRFGLFVAEVDAGTYIRTLCTDIGKICGGARMEELRRIAVGSIREQQAVSTSGLIDAVWLWKHKGDATRLNALIHAPEKFIGFPRVIIKENAIESIIHGARIMVPAVAVFPPNLARGDRVQLYSTSGIFVGVGVAVLSSAEWGARQHGLAVKPERVHVHL